MKFDVLVNNNFPSCVENEFTVQWIYRKTSDICTKE